MRASWAVALAAFSIAGGFGGTATGDGADATVNVPLPFDVPVRVLPLPAVANAPAGTLLVASLTDGTIWRVAPDGTVSGPIIDLPSSQPDGEFGLLGLALHPQWPVLPQVFAFFTDPPLVDGLRFQRIVRFNWFPHEAQAHIPVDVVTDVTTGALCCHNGGRIAFGPDGMLYATVGDNMISPQAQVPYTVAGKVLRYTEFGTVPADNPFPNSPVAVLGMRNTFGLHFDPILGMVATDNGPSGFDGIEGADEVNILQVGDNGGWPVMRAGVCVEVGPFECPVWQSGQVHLGPTGVTVPRNSAVPAWDGKILWCNVNNGNAMLVDPGVANPVPQVVFNPCHYDVAQDALGRIVFATNGGLRVVS